MEFLVDLGSFCIEAADEEAAYKRAREMINSDPSWATIEAITPNE